MARHSAFTIPKLLTKLSFKSLFIILFFLLISIIVLIKFVLPQKNVSAAWFNESWMYRVAVNIGNTSGSTLTDFQVPISIGTSALINAGKMQSDCDDIRVIDQNGNKISYWSSGCNTTDTKIWPKLASIPTSGITVYVYYGNPSASSERTTIGTAEEPGLSCKSILDAGNSNGTGNYWIDPTNGNTSDKFQAYCDMTNDSGGWMLVKSSMIGSTSNIQTTSAQTTDSNGGLIYTTTISTPGDCSNHSGKLYLQDIIPWTQIKADYTFTGGNSCWSIFGHTSNNADTNLIQFASATDTIRNQVRMGGSNGNNYDGINYRCDNETVNFWHSNQGYTARTAQVILRRNSSAAVAGLGIGTACVTNGYTWKYENIYIRETAMTFAATAGALQSEEVSPAPIAHWKFDEGIGNTTQDSTQNNLDANLNGAEWLTEDQCLSGKCIDLDGASGDNVTVGNNNLLNFGTNSFTISTWVLHRDYTYPKSNFIIKKSSQCYNSGAQNAGFDIGHGYKSNGIDICIHDTSNNYVRDTLVFNSGSRPPDLQNRWTHFVFIFNRSSGRVIAYINGTKQTDEVNISSVVGSINNSSALTVGTLYGWIMDAKMDDLKIYPYARTAAQVKSDYAAGKAGNSSSDGSSASLGSSPNSGGSLSDGLVAWYPLDGDATDHSGVGRTSTVSGATVTTGRNQQAYSFDGINDYIELGNVVNFQDFTISLWVYPSGSQVQYADIMDNYHQSSENFVIQQNSTTLNEYSWMGLPRMTLPANTWTHLVLTHNSTKADRYINGQLYSTVSSSAINYVTPSLRLGGSARYGRNWNGKMQDVRIYNRVVSPSEAQSLYTWAPGPIGYWDFNEKTGTIVNDKSGVGNTGIWNGSGSHWTNGKYGSGGNFNGSNDYVNGGNSLNFTSENFTISHWIKLNSLTTNVGGQGPVPFYKGSYQTNGYYSQIGTNGTVNFITNQSGTNQSSRTDIGTISTGNWYYISYVRNGSSVRIYINGIDKTSTAATHINPTSSLDNFQLGQYSNTINTNGQLDDFKIYNYARTQKQIVEDMNAGHPVGGSPVGSQLAYWKFDEGYGTTTSNWGFGGTSLNGTFGTGNSAPTWTNNGKYGKALSFNGSTTYLSVGLTAASSGAITMSAWVSTTDLSTSRKTIISDTSGGRHDLYIDGATPKCRTWDTSEILLTSTKTVSSGEWVHIACTMDFTNGGVYLYANGTLQASSNRTPISAGGNVQLGKSGSVSGNIFNGLMDEVKIYNSALTADEVKIDYNRNSALQFGSLSSGAGNTSPATSGSQEYCVPGDTSTCSGPVAEWKMDEKSGTKIFDTSGTGITGAITGATWTTGKIGSALKFSGSSQYVTVNDHSSLKPSSAITVESWFNTTNKSAQQKIISKTEGSGYQFSLNENSACASNTLCFLINIGSSYYSATYATSNLSNNTWYHATGTYDGSTVKLFLNGTNVGTTFTVSNTITHGAYPVCIGSETGTNCSNGGGQYFSGKIDQVRIFNYARSPAQIAWDYNRGGPIGWWKFDECQGNIAYDWSGIGNTGLITVGASGTQNSLGTCAVGTSAAWTNGASGKLNYSLNFDGSDDYVEFGDNSKLEGMTGITTSAWVYRTRDSGDSETILSKYWDGTNRSYKMYVYSDDRLRCLIPTDTQNDNDSAYGAAITLNQWHLLTCTWDSSGTIKAYVNGVLYESTNQTGNTIRTNTSPLRIAQDYYNGSNYQYFSGQIDDARIYNYALTATQVKTLYSNGAVNFGPASGSL